MLTRRARFRVRPDRIALALLASSLLVLAGCGSSSSGGSTTSATLPTPPICTQIGGVLGNGPDPGADPVGYAEAQIGPLAALHASNPTLQQAIRTLDTAFRHEFADNASAASKAAVHRAQRKVNSICPGAAS
jgi:hypothetical protein